MEGEKEEKGGQQIFSLGSPTYRFYVYRVDSNQNDAAQYDESLQGKLAQQEKQRDHTAKMQQQIVEVIAGWVKLPEAVVQRVGE